MRLLAFLPPVLVLVVGLALAAPAAAMTFERVTDAPGCEARACYVAAGEIGPDTAREFARLLREDRPAGGGVVILDSLGGDLLQGLALGGQIRKAGLSTHVQRYDGAARGFVAGGACASACAYAFLGGVTRSVEPTARYGLHQMHAPHGGLSPSDTQGLMALIAVHIQKMGGAMDLLISALRTPPNRMHWLSPRELASFGVVTPPAPLPVPATPRRAQADATAATAD